MASNPQRCTLTVNHRLNLKNRATGQPKVKELAKFTSKAITKMKALKFNQKSFFTERET
jgi:hypothetical protein